MKLSAVLSYPMLRLQMMRVGRGFTVHSPFAYHFITFVLRERLPYYTFRDEVTSKADRRLFRVVNYFNPATVAIVGSAPRAREVIALVCPHARTCADPADADFVYVADGEPLPADFRTLYAENDRSDPPHAMTFTNGRTLIAVRRHGLPAQSFLLRF